jgi:hypothetical protein
VNQPEREVEPTPPAPMPPAPARRPRPVLVELASAILIVGGALNLLISIQVIATLGTEGSEVGLLTLITVALAALSLTLGLLVRYGRAWLVAINVVAVVAFLELTSGSPVGLLLGGVDTFVVLALFRERPWFESAGPEPESDLRSYGG